MKYIIMCGLFCDNTFPKQLLKVNGEVLVERTIRLLKESGITDIAITSADERFGRLGVEWINYDSRGEWLNAFYFTDCPVCYLYGDVYYSPEAIKTIVEAEVEDIEFFASAPPFNTSYYKNYAEPFAFKVEDYIGFRNAVGVTKQLFREKQFNRMPISWELWQVIKGTPLNHIVYNYTIINDYTVDVDSPYDVYKLEQKLSELGSKQNYMIHTYPTRLWYVEKYLVPSMKEQGCENISIYVDEKHEGSMRAYMHSFLQLPNDGNGTWHLQDDVIICKDFKQRTEKYNAGIVCGFASQMYDKDNPAGNVYIKQHWYSFPCIRIPNKQARGCAEWTLKYIIGNDVYREFWKDGKNADWVFWLYVKDFCKEERVFNLAPNLVDHVDWLLGGSTVGSKRKEWCRSKYWEDENLVEELERRLKDAST